ncbi:hypothetical protein NLL45_03300 [Corynebacterium propinquum]|uniref:hypothetical protein n=1 Tax=Corynebacterium propinquum TaxID=43769 RepID=UPI001292EA68|nr:hypothetical protein [Corynebacterium propinquum]WKS32626.1 hypothetical protein NLL45_03300 [Corynebacterium propinquum]WKS36682.1 hypothetical protein NLL30_01720 [Corynebacterium propinquum]WKS38015.1 hypothetical protein NLL34_08345 [Corynebacterium propinquum]WKS43262.1 hypothetical protein NLL42_02360 [Corynebacterium propinquum]WKS46560.1 hypothetical protein NLL47_07980 [Corynebacterium propinquum]
MDKLTIFRLVTVTMAIIGYVVLASIGVDATVVGPISVVLIVLLLFVPLRRR